MSNPGPVAFPLLKLGLTRHGPCDEWFADRGKMHKINDARRRDDARFDVSPRFPSTGPQTFAANIAFVGFGGSCLGNRHRKYLTTDVRVWTWILKKWWTLMETTRHELHQVHVRSPGADESHVRALLRTFRLKL